MKYKVFLSIVVAWSLALAGCSKSTPRQPLLISAVPDQDASVVEARLNKVATFLAQESGLDVQYVPQDDYEGTVDAFRRGEVHLAWYGGLTGVQARLAVRGADAVAQRPRDAEFHSVFVAAPDSGIAELADLAGKKLAFGSESSNSGHLMPRFFLTQAGIDAQDDLQEVVFSGSHDETWKLVADGSVDAGALNEAVWESRVEAGAIDNEQLRVFYRTPSYVNYHWVLNRALDDIHGQGSADRLVAALLSINMSAGGARAEIAEAFQTDRFVATRNENYDPIEEVARSLGILAPQDP